MAPFRSKAVEPYRIPTLSDVDSGYASLLDKRGDLQTKKSELDSERRALKAAVAADTSREVRPSIAALLGDAPGTKALNRKRLAEINAELSDVEAAEEVVRQRLSDARGKASAAVCAAARPEYERRVRAMVDAMAKLDEAHKEFDELRFQFEAEDVAWTGLIPMTPTFLGGSNEPERRIARYIREAKNAGYA